MSLYLVIQPQLGERGLGLQRYLPDVGLGDYRAEDASLSRPWAWCPFSTEEWMEGGSGWRLVCHVCTRCVLGPGSLERVGFCVQSQGDVGSGGKQGHGSQ